MYYIIDRIEDGGKTVLESEGQRFILPIAELPEGAKEGDVLVDTGTSLEIDHEATAKRREKMSRLCKRVFGE